MSERPFEPYEVVFLYPEMAKHFEEWVASHWNWELSPPLQFSEEPDALPTRFIVPSKEAWDAQPKTQPRGLLQPDPGTGGSSGTDGH